MQWVVYEYTHYGRTERRRVMQCDNREDLHAFAKRYELRVNDLDKDIAYMESAYKYPMYMSVPQDYWSRCRFAGLRNDWDDSCRAVAFVPVGDLYQRVS